MEVLKVSAKSTPNSVAGALAGVIRERGAAEIQAIGAGALNQSIKAIAIARGLSPQVELTSFVSQPLQIFKLRVKNEQR
ncbi:Stage V sporulation protein S [Halalkalibacter krulwichiae]|uniref:Stage V sporulation protein S n=1 Tax=Halalkalibacter krulwichiae TaxID=199441 RepID=A0A1X9MC00_9BACI|nr:Stage V sporulation protein S [Halalkalibacter krulwichiae]